jgi:hypothetical protein
MEKKKGKDLLSYEEYLRKYFPKDTEVTNSETSLFEFNYDVSEKTFKKIKELLQEQKEAVSD